VIVLDESRQRVFVERDHKRFASREPERVSRNPVLRTRAVTIYTERLNQSFLTIYSRSREVTVVTVIHRTVYRIWERVYQSGRSAQMGCIILTNPINPHVHAHYYTLPVLSLQAAVSRMIMRLNGTWTRSMDLRSSLYVEKNTFPRSRIIRANRELRQGR